MIEKLFHADRNLPAGVRIELIKLLMTSLPQVTCIAVTGTIAAWVLAWLSPTPLDIALAASALPIALYRISVLTAFKRRSRRALALRSAQAWAVFHGAGSIAQSTLLSLMTLNALGGGNLAATILCFGLMCAQCAGASSRAAVVLWIPLITGPIMLVPMIAALLSRSDPVFVMSGIFLVIKLYAMIESAVHVRSTVVQNVMNHHKAAWEASHDHMTRLPNRGHFMGRLAMALHEARCHGVSCAVLYLDLDRFKHVNDTMGHAAGDELLCQVSERLRSAIGAGPMVARLGGDEFMVLATGGTSSEQVSELARRIVSILGEPFRLTAGTAEIGVSIGIAIAPEAGDEADALLSLADLALYRSKQEGRGRWHMAEPGETYRSPNFRQPPMPETDQPPAAGTTVPLVA